MFSIGRKDLMIKGFFKVFLSQIIFVLSINFMFLFYLLFSTYVYRNLYFSIIVFFGVLRAGHFLAYKFNYWFENKYYFSESKAM